MEYFKNDDNKVDVLGEYKIPRTWWSRGFEYAFASEFLNKDLKVLDAGCGLVHPFKLFAKDKVKKLVAIDKDVAILNANDENIEYRHQNIKDLDGKEKFDVVFCLGVLHHDKENLEANLKGLKNSLEADGIIVLTFDASLEVEEVKEVVKKLGLEYHKEHKEKPHNAIIGDLARVNVIKSILRIKKTEQKVPKVETKPKNKALKPKTRKKG